MRRRDLARGALAMLAPPSLRIGGAAAAGPTTWTMFTAQPAGSIAARGLDRLSGRVAAASKGALLLKLHVAGTLPVNATGLAAAVAAGTPQLADDALYMQPAPSGGLVRLPLLVNSAAEHAKASATLRPFLKTVLERRDLVFLGTLRAAPQSLWLRGPAAGLFALAGLRIRISFPEQAELLRRFGCIPVTLALAELPEALQGNALDGLFGTAAMIAALPNPSGQRGFACGLVGYQGQSDSALVANPSAWAALGPGLQAVLAAELDDAASWIAAARDAEEAAARDALASSGTAILDTPPADLEAARGRMARYWEDWARSRGRDAVDHLAVLRRALER